MKIAVVGFGAMGSVYAALLGDAGHELWAIDTWRGHIDAIRASGLRLKGASGNRTVRIHATTEPEKVGPCDLVIVATKAMDVEQAAGAARPLIGPDTAVLSIQNGLGGQLARACQEKVDRRSNLTGRSGLMISWTLSSGFCPSHRP